MIINYLNVIEFIQTAAKARAINRDPHISLNNLLIAFKISLFVAD